MKEIIKKLYDIDVLTFIKIGTNVYKVKTDNKNYALKYIEQNLNEFIDYQNNIKNTDLNDLVLINKKFAIFSFYDDIHFLIKN